MAIKKTCQFICHCPTVCYTPPPTITTTYPDKQMHIVIEQILTKYFY